MKKINKKGDVHIDWVISIAIFLTYIIILLAFIKPSYKPSFEGDVLVKMVKDSFYKMLSEMGFTEIQILGKEFDPHLAEAVDIVSGEKDNMVKEILRRGYSFNGKILRVAQVKVSKKVIN